MSTTKKKGTAAMNIRRLAALTVLAALAALVAPGCASGGAYEGMCWEHCSDALKYGGQACGTLAPVYDAMRECGCADNCTKECGGNFCRGEAISTECTECLYGHPSGSGASAMTDPCYVELAACRGDQL